MKEALITGVTGQDGAYLAELLLGNGYEIHEKCNEDVGRHYLRPTEVEPLLGNPAKTKLGRTPKITHDALVAEVVSEDLKAAERGGLAKKQGNKAVDYHE